MTGVNQNPFIRISAGYVSEIKSGEDNLIADVSVNQGGEDTEPQPYEVLLSAKIQIGIITDLIW